MRYNYGWFDLFGEVATSQNQEWGFGTIVGSRFYPADGVNLIALYRYYSPWFDNEYGYAFSESSRMGDENGGYVGFDITRLKNWRFSGYGDVFYFSGYKYGLGNDTATIGYDALAEAKYSVVRSQYSAYSASLRLRARKKGNVSTYSVRALFEWSRGGWSLRTTADANYVESYGVSLAQDIAYDFTPYTAHHTPLSLRLRLQAFDARKWENRIYLYEHDVLYAFSIPATYGLGGRAYFCLRWQIIKQLALYLRVSETVYSDLRTKTDLHFLLRATL